MERSYFKAFSATVLRPCVSCSRRTGRIVTGIILFLIAAGISAEAQRFTLLKSYGIVPNVTGAFPAASLVQAADGTLYGTTRDGEGDFRGVLFKMQPDGTGFAVLKFFHDNSRYPGAQSPGNLILNDSILYGTTAADGTTNYLGTLFRINTDGTQFSVLRSFDPFLVGRPTSLLLSGSTLYGTTEATTNGGGTVFRMNVDGTGYTVLKSLQGTEGKRPSGRMVLINNTLYGTTFEGGNSGYGTLFKLSTDGSGFAVVREFDSDGRNPYGSLFLSGSTLYGVSYGRPIGYYGYSSMGVVFRVNTDGTGYGFIRSAEGSGSIVLDSSTIYGTWTDNNDLLFRLNTDGTGYQTLKNLSSGFTDWAYPGGLLFNGGTLYGVTSAGGSHKVGTAFSINPDGSGYAVLKNFGFSDAQSPQGSLTLAANALYGTTLTGGKSEAGTLFKLNTNGTDYTVLAEFDSSFSYPYSVNANPVLVDGTTLYGTTIEGGSQYYGMIYKVNTDGTGFTVLKHMTLDAARPYGRLVLGGSALYGTTESGGSFGRGAVFSINPDGTDFTILKSFNGTDGYSPRAGLVLSGTRLYGTAFDTLFALNTDGSDYTVLKSFPSSEGVYLQTPVVLNAGTLYGTAYSSSAGGPIIFKLNTDGSGYSLVKSFPGAGYGISELTLNGNSLLASMGSTLFQINTDGTGYFVWKTFTPAEGWSPSGGLASDGRVLFGATARGGEVGSGTLFR